MKKLVSLILLSGIGFYSNAQVDSTNKEPVKKEDKPLKFNLNEDGSHFFQATFLNQTWVRFNESNPGTTVLGDPQSSTFDIGIRRARIQLFGQITDRAFVYFQFGFNNYNRIAQYDNRKVQAFFHDAVGEYRLSKGNELKIGGGLTIVNGLSRFSQPSVSTILALDVPVFAQATVDQTDLFSRKLSVYARGQVGKIDYRFAFSDPFPVTSNGQVVKTSVPTSSTNASFSQFGHTHQYQGYVMYQFWEKEGHLTPYMPGTYLGKKRVLNIAGGAIYQPKAMWILDSGNTKLQKMLLWSVEAFMDTPLNKEKGTALTAYIGYFNTDYGTNYIRTGAQMNPADSKSIDPTISAYSGGGNGFPMMGTGNVIYCQAGYLLPKNLLGENHGALQPYATWQHNNFKALNQAVNVYDIGVNWLLSGQKSKLSLDYQSRPVFYTDQKVGTRKGAVILQYQLFI